MKEIIVSIFKGYSDVCPGELTLKNVIEHIRSDAARDDKEEWRCSKVHS